MSIIDLKKDDNIIRFCIEHGFLELDKTGIDKSDFFRKTLNHGFIYKEGNKTKGVLTYKNLDYDTKLFRIPSLMIQEIIATDQKTARNLLTELQRKGRGFYQAKIDSRNSIGTAALLNAKFKLISHDITLMKKSEEHNIQENIFSCSEEDVREIAEIAEKSFTHTRFHADPKIQKKKANLLQRDWARNCYLQRLSDRIFVYKEEQVSGFIACSILKNKFQKGKKGRIVLIAVDKRFRGRSIGKKLIHAADNWFSRQGCDQVIVGTQSKNIAALRFYKKNGFGIINDTYCFHYWND